MIDKLAKSVNILIHHHSGLCYLREIFFFGLLFQIFHGHMTAGQQVLLSLSWFSHVSIALCQSRVIVSLHAIY